MKNRNSRHKPSRIEKLERKCNLILSQLLIIRQKLNEQPTDLDRTIDRLHYNARRLRCQAQAERDLLRGLFNS